MVIVAGCQRSGLTSSCASDGIAKRTHRELDQNIAILGGIVMDKKAFAILPDFKPETDKVALTAVDPSYPKLGLK